MQPKPSNNIIPNLHRLITNELGENYWFNGCAKYVMEGLGEPDFDYVFFAGLTGDVFTQCYSFDQFRGEGVTGYALREGNTAFYEEIFAKCGYACTFVTQDELNKNPEMYLQTLIAYIDKGVPVIAWGRDVRKTVVVSEDRVFVGYEDHGQTLLYITGNSGEPVRIPLGKAISSDTAIGGWIFVGQKKENRTLAQIYRGAIFDLPYLLTVKTEQYCHGAQAFRAWAAEIEGGRFDGMRPEEFDGWFMYNTYICALATNGSCCHEFLQRARELNPDMDFLVEISKLYQKTADMWNNQNGEDLEALGGGFNVTLYVLQNKLQQEKIIAMIRECADVMVEVVRLLEINLSVIEK